MEFFLCPDENDNKDNLIHYYFKDKDSIYVVATYNITKKLVCDYRLAYYIKEDGTIMADACGPDIYNIDSLEEFLNIMKGWKIQYV